MPNHADFTAGQSQAPTSNAARLVGVKLTETLGVGIPAIWLRG